jgi:hypothetical protein
MHIQIEIGEWFGDRGGKTRINQTHHHVGAIICTYFVPYATKLIVEALKPLRTAAMPNHWQWRGAQYVAASRM